MISHGSEDWVKFLFNLEFSKRKSNRDVLCVDCWEILTYEQRSKHEKDHPDHSNKVMTSKWYGSENQFLTLARDMKKVHIIEGKEMIENPFKGKMRRKKQQEQMLASFKQLEGLTI